jgi:dihydroflavonol-4-reductase
VRVSVTGATGFVGGHVARLLAERGDEVRVTFRDEGRLDRLRDLQVEPVRADILDRPALRRALRGTDVLFHTAGLVASRPRRAVWETNALAPRVVVEAAAAEDVGRVVVTSSVAGVGPAPPGRAARETDVFRGGGLGLTYVEAKHEGEVEAIAAGARHGIEVVVVNPSYVLGVPVDRAQRGETSTRMIGNYLRGRLPAVVDAYTNIVDVEDAAAGHLLAAERGRPGERYILGGHDVRWGDLIDRVARLSGVQVPLMVLPPELERAARLQARLGLPTPIAPEGVALMAQNWRHSSARARRELGYRPRSLDRTLRATIEWYLELIDAGVFAGDRPSPMSILSWGMRTASGFGLASGLRSAERLTGRRLVAGTG